MNKESTPQEGGIELHPMDASLVIRLEGWKKRKVG